MPETTDHPRTQTRILVGFWPDDLEAIDELAVLLQPDRPRPERAHAIRVAIREELKRRRKRAEATD